MSRSLSGQGPDLDQARIDEDVRQVRGALGQAGGDADRDGVRQPRGRRRGVIGEVAGEQRVARPGRVDRDDGWRGGVPATVRSEQERAIRAQAH